MGRHAIAGPTPLTVFDANTPGSGRSKCVHAAGIIATGEELPPKTWPKQDEEVRKTITAVAIEGLLDEARKKGAEAQSASH